MGNTRFEIPIKLPGRTDAAGAQLQKRADHADVGEVQDLRAVLQDGRPQLRRRLEQEHPALLRRPRKHLAPKRQADPVLGEDKKNTPVMIKTLRRHVFIV